MLVNVATFDGQMSSHRWPGPLEPLEPYVAAGRPFGLKTENSLFLKAQRSSTFSSLITTV